MCVSFIQVSVSDLYIAHDWFACSAAGKYVDRFWEIAHRHMNMEIGTEAAQILFWKYISGIFVAMQDSTIDSSLLHKCLIFCTSHLRKIKLAFALPHGFLDPIFC
jgi:hypothetical protein